jgi:hypothetical protein
MPIVVADAVRIRLEYVLAQEHRHKTGRQDVVLVQQAHQQRHQQAKAQPQSPLRVQLQQVDQPSTPQERRMSATDKGHNLLEDNVYRGPTARPHVAQALPVSAADSGRKPKLAKQVAALCLGARLEVYPLLSLLLRRLRLPLQRKMLWQALHPPEAQLSTQLEPRMSETASGLSLLEGSACRDLIVLLRVALDRVVSAPVLERKHKLGRLGADSSLGVLPMRLPLPLLPHLPLLSLAPPPEAQRSTQLESRMSETAPGLSSLGDSVCRERTVLQPVVLAPLESAVVWEHKPRLARLGVVLFLARSF